MSRAVLQMHAVQKSFATAHGRADVLRGVDLTVAEGEFVMMTGPSGSGKSTCLHIAALLDRPSAGTLVFDGEDVGALPEDELCSVRKHKVGIVFQKYCLLPRRSVADNVAFRFRYLDVSQAYVAQRVAETLRVLGLEPLAARAARVLSGGEMQRVAIARAIAQSPALLIADEPTGNLDAASTAGVMECFRKLNAAGMTILMVTHNESLLRFASRHVRLADGACAIQ